MERLDSSSGLRPRVNATTIEKIIVVAPTTAVPIKTGLAVALNVLPAPSFSSKLFLAVSLAVSLTASQGATMTTILSAIFFLIALVFVYRSFYGMRIESE